ncbi:MAG: NADH-quinone oxidoreductase subunit J [Pleurocapsa sp. MO_192.B19]|nr:NADH-quinone oxidoreductase subunit J [Pleurocapsa sp. MO_192.B19]
MNLAEGVQIVSFGILAAMMIGTALGVVLLPNIVHSAFLLAGVFVSISGLYILLNADFVAAAQILVYVGAVNVLILFAIMLVNKQENFAKLPGRLIRKVSTAVVCFGLFALLGTMVLVTPWSLDTTSPAVINTVVSLGEHFFSDYLLPFELASVLLLMAMVGAIILARRDLIPESVARQETVTTSLTLPERPRELATLSGNEQQD